MATCVKVAPAGTPIAVDGSGVEAPSLVPIIVADPGCTAGLVVMASADMKLQVSPEPVDPQRVADMYQLAIAFVAVFAAIWGLKQIYRIFSGDMERD